MEEKLREAILSRFRDDGKDTNGILSVVDSTFSCDSLERPWLNNARGLSCIPQGRYLVKWSLMFTAKKYHYQVMDVPKRSAIFIHGGNYFIDSHGCILLGDKTGDMNKDGENDIKNSRPTIKEFEDLMEQKDFWITIE